MKRRGGFRVIAVWAVAAAVLLPASAALAQSAGRGISQDAKTFQVMRTENRVALVCILPSLHPA